MRKRGNIVDQMRNTIILAITYKILFISFSKQNFMGNSFEVINNSISKIKKETHLFMFDRIKGKLEKHIYIKKYKSTKSQTGREEYFEY